MPLCPFHSKCYPCCYLLGLYSFFFLFYYSVMLKVACMYMSVRLKFLHNEMTPSSFRMPNCSTGKGVKHQVYAEILFKRNEQKKIMSSDTALYSMANLSKTMLRTGANFVVSDDRKWISTL